MNDGVISKIRCNNPNKKGASIRNYNLAIYIGTRAGTDLTPVDNAFNLDHGLFGNINTNNDIHMIAKYISAKSRSGTNVYNGIISLSERDAARLGYLDKNRWLSYMKSVMPTIGRNFGISFDKLEWIAAIHMEKGHPHCHYMFWNIEDKIRSPFIHPSLQDKTREYLSSEFTREERLIYVADKTAARDCIISFGKEKMVSIMQEIRNSSLVPSLPGRMNKNQSTMLNEKVKDLFSILPKNGRLNYKYIPIDVKNKVDEVTEILLYHNDIAKLTTQYFKSVKEISKAYSASSYHSFVNDDIAKNDLYRRIGNIILKACKNFLTTQTNNTSTYTNVTSCCYSIFRDVFTALEQENHLMKDKLVVKNKGLSKEQKKAELKKREI